MKQILVEYKFLDQVKVKDPFYCLQLFRIISYKIEWKKMEVWYKLQMLDDPQVIIEIEQEQVIEWK